MLIALAAVFVGYLAVKYGSRYYYKRKFSKKEK